MHIWILRKLGFLVSSDKGLQEVSVLLKGKQNVGYCQNTTVYKY